MENKRKRPDDDDDATNVEKRPRLTSAETTGTRIKIEFSST